MGEQYVTMICSLKDDTKMIHSRCILDEVS